MWRRRAPTGKAIKVKGAREEETKTKRVVKRERERERERKGESKKEWGKPPQGQTVAHC